VRLPLPLMLPWNLFLRLRMDGSVDAGGLLAGCSPIEGRETKECDERESPGDFEGTGMLDSLAMVLEPGWCSLVSDDGSATGRP
jgi:hypothetical protein